MELSLERRTRESENLRIYRLENKKNIKNYISIQECAAGAAGAGAAFVVDGRVRKEPYLDRIRYQLPSPVRGVGSGCVMDGRSNTCFHYLF